MSTISCPLFSTLSIASVSHTMSVHSTMFPVYQPFELERVMPVSSGVKTRSSNKTVLPLGGDSTPVVHAQEPALPHITQTLADCTPTAMDREPASPNLTPTPADSNPVPVDTAPSPPQSSQTRAVSKAAPVPKGPVLSRRTPTPPVSTPIPVEEAQPASRSLASIAFDVVKSYVRIFPSWKYYTEDEGKCQLQVFVQELCVSNVIHGNYFALSHTSYLHDGYNIANFPIFLYREGPIWKLRMR